MEQTTNKVTIELILDQFKNYSEKKSMREIKIAVANSLNSESDIFFVSENREAIDKIVAELIAEDKKLAEKSSLVYRNGKYSKRRKVAPPQPGDELPSTYKGTAGECAVMSELMFHGYNANRMMIDEGVDVIAVKSNIYYYIQVKTTAVKANGNIVTEIKIDRFNQYSGLNQMYYAIVARSKDSSRKWDANIIFMIPHLIIQQGIANRAVKQTEQGVSIKIKFDERTGEAYLYDDRDMSIEFYRNRFNL